MSEVEQRVVQMKFDNAQFEAGVQKTLQSLKTLDNQIENTTAVKPTSNGLAKIFDTLGVGASNAEENITKLAKAFSPLGVIGRTVLENLTNKAANFAIQAGKTLSGINSITSGFDKFAQKSKAVSDLMNATGASMTEVNDALDNLNWFTDETSYNFTDMVSTMSKLAATGEKDLTKLTRSAEGIALWGAKAGANAQTVSRAMYQLTQAVGRGYITYQDWLQSAVNTNMATAEIKQQLIEAGGAAAIAAGAQTDFNNSLKDGWLTFDIFNQVMDYYTEGINSANYANGEFINSQNGVEGATNAFSEAAFRNAQECKSWGDVVDAVADAVGTGWMQTFEYVFGNYEEAKALWTGLANLAFTIADKFSSSRNAIFSDWKDNGGRLALIQTMVNLINALYRVIKPVGQAFAEVFGEISGKNLASTTKSLASFTEALKISHLTMMKIKKVFVEIFTVVKTVISVITPFIKYILLVSSINTILKTTRTILSGGLGFGTVLTLIRAIIVLGVTGKLTGFNKVLGAVANAIKIVIGALASVVLKIKEFISTISKTSAFNSFIKLLNLIKTAVVSLVSTLVTNIPKILTSIKNSKIFDFIVQKITSLAMLLGEFIIWVVEKISNAGSAITSLFNRVGSAAQPLNTVVKTTKEFSTELTKTSKNAEITAKMMNKVNESLDKSNKKRLNHTKAVKADSDAIKIYNNTISASAKTESIAMDIASASIKKNTESLSNFVSKIREVVDYLRSKVDWDNVLAVGALLIYCMAIKKLGDAFKSVGNAINTFHTNLEGIRKSIIGMFQSFQGVGKSISSYFSSLEKNLKNEARFKWFYQIAIGIGVLTAALIALSYVPFDKIKTGALLLGGITLTVIALAGAFTYFSNKVNPVKVIALAGAILAVAAASIVLAVELGLIAAVVNIVINACTDAETGAINFAQALLRLVTPIVVIAAVIISLSAGLKIMMDSASVLSPTFLKAAVGVLAISGALAAFGASLIVISLGIGSLILIVAIVIRKFMEMGRYLNECGQNTEKMNSLMSAVLVGVLAFLGVGGLVIGVIKLLNNVTRDMAVNALILAAAFTVLAISLTIIGNLTGDFVSGIGGIGTALTVLALFMAVLSTGFFRKAIANLNSFARGLLGLSASVLILAGAVVIFSKVDPSTIMDALSAVGLMMMGLAVVIKILDKASIGKVAVGVLALVVALYALIPIFLLMTVAFKELVPGAIICVGVLLGLAGSLRLLSSIDLAKSITGMVVLAAVMGVLTVCFKQLSTIPLKQLAVEALAMVGSFAILTLTIGLFMDALSVMTGAEILKIVAGMGLFIAVLLSFAAVLYILQGVSTDKIIAFFVGFAASIIVFTVAAAALMVVISALSAELNMAIPFLGALTVVLISVAAVMLSFGVAAVLFGYGASLVVNALANLILAINTFIPTVEHFISFLISISDKGEELKGVSETLVALKDAMLGAAVGLLALGAAAIVFAVGGTLAAVAMFLFTAAGVALSGSLDILTGSLQNFLTLLVAFGSQTEILKGMAGALALIGVALIPFAAGAALAGVALPILAVGVTLVSAALSLLVLVMERAMNAIIKFKASLAMIDVALAGTAKSAKGCGVNLINGFIEGITSGVSNLMTAIKSVGESIITKFKDVLGIHSPSKKTEIMGKFLDLGLIEGIDKNSSGITTSVEGIAGNLSGLDGLFGNIGSNLGGTFIGKLGSTISSGLNNLTIGGVNIGSLLGVGSSSSSWDEDSVFGRQNARNQKKQHIIEVNRKNANNNEYYNSHKTQSDDDIVSTEDFLNELGLGDLADQLNASTSALDDNTSALGSNSSAAGSAADSQDELADALKNVEDNAKSSLDFFSSFDKSLSSVISPKEMIANFESQSSGITSFYTNLGALAGKGYSQDFIQSLMEEGTSAYPKVASMLKATAEEAAQIQKAWDSKATIAANAKLLASTALTTAATIANLKKEDTARQNSLKNVNECLSKYKKSIETAQNANLDLNEILLEVQDSAVDTGEAMKESGPKEELITSYKNLRTAMMEVGLSNEQLQEAMTNDNGFEVTKNEVLTIMERIADTQAIIAQFQDIGSGIFDNVKSQISSSISYFDEWSAKYEMTGNQLMSNVQSQIEGVAKYTENIQTIISNGGGEIVQLFGDKITPEIANAMAQLGAEQMSVLQTNLTTLSNAPIAGATAAQASWLQYGKIGGMGYQEALAQLASDQSLLAQTQEIGVNVGQGLVNGMNESLETVQTAGNTLGQSTIDGVAEGAGTHSPSIKTHEIGYNVDQGLMDGIDEQMFTTKAKGVQLGEIVIAGIILGISTLRPTLMACVRMTCSMTKQTFADGLNKDYFVGIGYNICAGLVEGIESGRSEVINSAVSVATAAYEEACAALEVQSPSRKMIWVGQMFDAGLAKGIDDGSNSVNDTVSSAMIQALSTAADMIESDDMCPTITPVIDLSDVQNGSRLIGSMFGNGYGLNVKTNIGQITTPTDRMSAAIQGIGSNSATFGDTNINIYASAGMDENALADKVIKRINVEYARRKAAWS